MTRLTSGSAEEYLASHCFDTGPTGFVAASVQLLPVALAPDPPSGPVFERLRHGYLSGDRSGVLEVSIPPSPGLDVAVRRLAADLATARTLLARQGLAAGERAVGTHLPALRHSDFRTGTAAVRVSVDAGAGPADLERRWQVAQAAGPVLAAAFANSPLRAGGRPAGAAAGRRCGSPSTLPGRRATPGRPGPPTSWSTGRPAPAPVSGGRYAAAGRSTTKICAGIWTGCRPRSGPAASSNCP